MKINKEEIELFSKKVKKDYNFCILSDIHNTKYIKLKFWEYLIKIVKEENPNYIFIPGDFIYIADDLVNTENKMKLEYLLSELSFIAPTYICLGNHDLKSGNILTSEDALNYFRYLAEKYSNFHLLENNAVEIDGLNIIGLNPTYNAYYFKYKSEWFNYLFDTMNVNILKKLKNSNYTVLLTHSPETICESESYIEDKLQTIKNKFEIERLKLIRNILQKIDLFLCGHMHDGLIPRHWQRLGIVKGDIGFCASEGNTIKDAVIRKVNKCRGMHNLYNGKLIITRGITKWCQPNIVFGKINNFCSKDITIVKLRKLK